MVVKAVYALVPLAFLQVGCLQYRTEYVQTNWGEREHVGSTTAVVPDSRVVVNTISLVSSAGGDVVKAGRTSRESVLTEDVYETKMVNINSARCYAPNLILFYPMGARDEFPVENEFDEEWESTGSLWIFPYTSRFWWSQWHRDVRIALIPPFIVFPIFFSIGPIVFDLVTLPYHTAKMIGAEWNTSETKTDTEGRTESVVVSTEDMTSRLSDVVVSNATGARLHLRDVSRPADLSPLLALTGGDERLTVEARLDGESFTSGLTVSGSTLETIRERTRQLARARDTSLPPHAAIEPRVPSLVTPGTPTELSVALTNDGKGDFSGLVGTVVSDEPELNGLRLHFGTLAPGEGASVTLPVDLPATHRGGSAPVRIAFSEGNGWTPADLAFDLTVRPPELPRLVPSIQVVDDGSGSSVGNGDGRVQKREAVDLLVTVRNEGSGRARDVRAQLSSAQAGLRFGSAQTIASLQPGESRELRLNVQVRPEFAETELRLQLALSDGVHGGEPVALRYPLDARITPRPVTLDPPLALWTARDDSPLRASAEAGAPTLMQVGASLPLDALAVLDDAYQVRFRVGDVERTGWIARADVQREPPVGAGGGGGSVVTVIETRDEPPSVLVALPQDGTRTASERVQLVATVGDAEGLSAWDVTLDGVPVAFDTRDLGNAQPSASPASEARREVNLAAEVALHPGLNELVVRAVDTRGQERTKTVRIERETASRDAFVVAIGIDDYADPDIPDLKYAEDDASAVFDALCAGLAVPKEHALLLTGRGANRVAILEALTLTVREQAGPEDTVIVYYAGHGTVDPDSRQPDGLAKFFVPQDARKRSLRATALAFDDLADELDRLPCERIVFLADACFSGGQGRGFAESTRALPDDVYDVIARGEGRVWMAACGANEVAAERNGHGLFTSALLSALSGQADVDHDGSVSFSEAYLYVAKTVKQQSGGQQGPRRGGAESGEIALSVLHL